jgi:hypothetical protein
MVKKYEQLFFKYFPVQILVFEKMHADDVVYSNLGGECVKCEFFINFVGRTLFHEINRENDWSCKNSFVVFTKKINVVLKYGRLI